jgi:predicted aspartyl protease
MILHTISGALGALSVAVAIAPPIASIPLTENIFDLYTLETNVGRSVLFSGNPEADPVPFIVDTGANHTAVPRLIAEQLISQQDISFDQIAHGMTGQFDTDLFFVDQLDFGLGPRTVEVAIFTEAYGAVMSAAGLLGANAFTNEIIELDFPGRSLNLLPSSTEVISADLRLTEGLVLGQATLHGVEQPIHILIDTGATVSLVNSALLRAKNARSSAQEIIRVEGVSGGAETSGELRRVFSRLQVDTFCIDLFQVTVADVYAFDVHGWMDEPAMILGMDVLRDGRLTLDYGRDQVMLSGQGDTACTRPRIRTPGPAAQSPR